LKDDETALVSTIAAATLFGVLNDEYHQKAYRITQPTIRPLFNTKQFQDVLLSLTVKQVIL
jgi:molybdopterin-containing oxidoreductase family iron-sulfur binding subunit